MQFIHFELDSHLFPGYETFHGFNKDLEEALTNNNGRFNAGKQKDSVRARDQIRLARCWDESPN